MDASIDPDDVATKKDIDAKLEVPKTAINARTDARIAQHTLVIVARTSRR